MWIRSSDSLSENVFQIITATSSHYLILGDCSAIVDAGIAATADTLIEEIEAVLGEDGTLEFILLSHAHFDHVGGIVRLRERWPELEIFSSPATAQLLGDETLVSKLYEKNKAASLAANSAFEYSLEQFSESLNVDRIMGDGDVLDLGDGVEIKMIACPGHTADFVSYYVRPDCALIAGEAVGQYSGRDQIHLAFCDSYKEYLESMDRLSTLEIKLLGFAHSGTLSGELIGKYFQSAREQAERFCETVRERIKQGELQEEVFAALLGDWQAQQICPDGPFVQEQEDTLKAMIKAAATYEPATEKEPEPAK